MQVLWAPWRMAYVGGPRVSACIFCAALTATEPRRQLVLQCAPAIVMLNKFPYVNGHLMVAPRRHGAGLDTLPADEFAALMEAVRGSARVLAETLRPAGMNIGVNLGAAAGAGLADHLHWHIVPRWIGDVNFMPVLAEVRVIPEHLQSLYDRLRPHFEAPAAV